VPTDYLTAQKKSAKVLPGAPSRRTKERGGIHNRSNAAEENHAKDYRDIMYGKNFNHRPSPGGSRLRASAMGLQDGPTEEARVLPGRGLMEGELMDDGAGCK
jgi:hypothetical protein